MDFQSQKYLTGTTHIFIWSKCDDVTFDEMSEI